MHSTFGQYAQRQFKDGCGKCDCGASPSIAVEIRRALEKYRRIASRLDDGVRHIGFSSWDRSCPA